MNTLKNIFKVFKSQRNNKKDGAKNRYEKGIKKIKKEKQIFRRDSY